MQRVVLVISILVLLLAGVTLVDPSAPSAGERQPSASSHRSSKPAGKSGEPSATAIETTPFATQAETASPLEPTSGTARIQVVDAAGNARSGVWVTFPELPLLATGRSPSRLRTDVRGEILLERLRPGALRAFALLGGSAVVHVRAGAEARARVVVPDGVCIRGRVVAPNGTPVGGADVLSTTTDHPGSPSVPVAKADAQGRFRITTATDRVIAARAARFGASASHRIRKRSTEGELVLKLRPEGGHLRGLVVDMSGAPVAKARVQARPLDPGAHSGADGRTRATCPTLEVSSDPSGAFSIPGIPAGPCRLLVEAAGLAPRSVKEHVGPGTTRFVRIRLSAGFAVSGDVRTLRDGAPVAGAMVACAPFGLFVGTPVIAVTDGNGRYTLRHLPPGRATLTAVHPQFGRTRAGVSGSAGDRRRLRLTLDAGRALRGRVLTTDGAPLPSLLVQAIDDAAPEGPSGPRVLRSARTGRDGSFFLPNLPPRNLRVVVLDLRHPNAPPLVSRPDVRAGERPLDLEVAHSARPTATIRGRIRDQVPVELLARPLEGDAVVVQRSVEGAFRLGPLVPGRYRLEAKTPWRSTVLLASLQLTADEQRDLGTLSLPAPGELRINIMEVDALPRGNTDLRVSPVGGSAEARSVAPIVLRGREVAEPLPLPAGTWRVESFREGALATETTAVVHVGGRTHTELRLRRALGLDVTCTGAGTAKSVRLEFRQGSRVLHAVDVVTRSGQARTFVRLPPGHFECRAETPDGARAQSPITLRVADQPDARDHASIALALGQNGDQP